jgi:hypothetical protein
MSDSHFNPRNTQYLDACPDEFSIGAVKMVALLDMNKKS